VERQLADPGSLLNFTKKLIALRREYAALQGGELELIEGPPGVLAFLRSAGSERILVAMNFRARPAMLRLREKAGTRWRGIFPASKDSQDTRYGEFELEPHEVRLFYAGESRPIE
jgi:glycosidase